jgi:hypothetical protein
MKCQGKRGQRCGDTTDESAARQKPRPIEEVELALIPRNVHRELRETPIKRSARSTRTKKIVLTGTEEASGVARRSTAIMGNQQTGKDTLAESEEYGPTRRQSGTCEIVLRAIEKLAAQLCRWSKVPMRNAAADISIMTHESVRSSVDAIQQAFKKTAARNGRWSLCGDERGAGYALIIQARVDQTGTTECVVKKHASAMKALANVLAVIANQRAGARNGKRIM